MEESFEGPTLPAHLKRPQLRRAWGCLARRWTDLKVHRSGEAGEDPLGSTGEEGGPGKVEKHRRLEGKRNRGKGKEISRNRAYRFATKFLPPRTLLVYKLANAVRRGFSHESPYTREHCLVQPVRLPTRCDSINCGSYTQCKDKTIHSTHGTSEVPTSQHDSVPTQGNTCLERE